jgi:head-tail adaptor
MAKRNLMNGAAIPMEPGERDRAVTIQQLSETVVKGVPKESWTTLVATAWMRKMGLKSSERFTAQQVKGSADTQWEMDYREDMDPELVDVVKTRRLLYLGRAYDITGADVIGRREGIELLTLSGSGGVL